MKRKMDMRIIGVFLAVSMLAAMPAYAGGNRPECKPGEKGDRMMAKMTADLGLTQAQQDQMKALHEGQRERAKALRDKSRSVRDAMRGELDRADTDMVKVNGYVDELAGIFKEKTKQRVDGILAMKKVLTPEQFQKLNEKMKEKMEHMRKKGGMRPGRVPHHGDEDGE